MAIHGCVGFVDWTKAKIVGPTVHFTVDASHDFFHIQQTVPAGCNLADLAAEPLDLFGRRTRAYVGAACFRRVAASDRVTQEVE